MDSSAYRLHHDACDLVRASVRCRSSVLKVTLAVCSTLAGDTDRCATVGNAPVELVDACCLMLTGHALNVPLTVQLDMLNMTLLKFAHGSLNGFHTTILAHISRRDIGVKTGSVPVALDGLGSERNLNTEFLSDAVKEPTSHPEVIAHYSNISTGALKEIGEFPSHTFDTLTWTDLEFPLGRHNLCIDTRNLDARVQASLVMCLYNITAEDFGSPNPAVVRSLWSGETTLWPAVWPSIGAEECVLLLETKPWFLIFVGLHLTGGVVTIVEFVGGAIVIPGFTHDKDVVAESDGIRENGNRAKVDVRVVAPSLAAG